MRQRHTFQLGIFYPFDQWSIDEANNEVAGTMYWVDSAGNQWINDSGQQWVAES